MGETTKRSYFCSFLSCKNTVPALRWGGRFPPQGDPQPTLTGASLANLWVAKTFLVQLKRLYNQLDIGVRFSGLSFNIVECSTEVREPGARWRECGLVSC